MREQTTPSGYDQPETDQIPHLGDEPDGRYARSGHATDPAGAPAPVPEPAAPMDGPSAATTGSAGAPPAGPERARDHRHEYEVDNPGRGDHDAGRSGATPAPADEPTAGMPGGLRSAPVSDAPADASASGSGRAGEDTGAVLFGEGDVERFRLRWREVQADFVDDPKHAVQGADRLVEEVMGALSDLFTAHKRELESQWHGGDHGETEELRLALRRYRSFFDQLLKT